LKNRARSSKSRIWRVNGSGDICREGRMSDNTRNRHE
jgi:hypothetical protein